MSTMKKLSVVEFGDFARIMANAYPGLKVVSEQDRDKMKYRLIDQDKDPAINFYGLYRDGQLPGGMRLNDFTMWKSGST